MFCFIISLDAKKAENLTSKEDFFENILKKETDGQIQV